MKITRFMTQTHQPVALQRCDEEPIRTRDELEILDRGVPRVEEDGAGSELFIGDGTQEHLAEVFVLSFAVRIGVVDAVVNGKELIVSTRRVNKVDDADASH